MSPPGEAADRGAFLRRPRPAAAPATLLLCLAVLAGLMLTGALSVVPAAIAAAVLAGGAIVLGLLPGLGQSDQRGLASAAAASRPATDISAQSAVADLVAAMPMPAVVLDGDSLVIAANAAASKLAPALRRGEPALLVLRLPAIVDAVRRALATGTAQRAAFSERVPIDRWWEAHAIPVGKAAPPHLLLLTFHDLTPLRLMEQTRADFVANASHELRTPLAALSGFIDTLQGPAREDAKAREDFLGIMKQQALRMARLIDDLLSLSRVELNQHIPPQGEVDLVAVLGQVIEGLQLLARERRIEIALDAPAQLAVSGDRDELVRVFVNLVENALKYGGSGRRVEIAIRAADSGEVAVAVRDQGPGIAPEHLPRLTERFYRVDVSHSRAEGGTGLGLALVKHIVTRHRGRLAIESAPGKGATFTVFLPLHRP